MQISSLRSTTSILKRMQLRVACQKSGLRLTKFLVNNIHIYDFKLIYYENTFHNWSDGIYLVS
jgi:hypothetical protein